MPHLKRLGLSLGIAWLFLGFVMIGLVERTAPTYAVGRTTPLTAADDTPAWARLAGQDLPERVTFEPILTPTLEGELYLPLVTQNFPFTCPTTSEAQFELIRLPSGAGIDHPDYLHGDLNLALRGYQPVVGPELKRVSLPLPPQFYNNEADALQGPQLATLFNPPRVPQFEAAYQVNNWIWDSNPCGGNRDGCRGSPLTPPGHPFEVTLLGLATRPGEPVRLPARGPAIFDGGYRAVVVYAEEERITLAYQHGDGVAVGHAVHLENVCVDPNLLARYQAQNKVSGFRASDKLPALHAGQVLGYAAGAEMQVAVRYYGKFMDPRSGKEWWPPFVYSSDVQMADVCALGGPGSGDGIIDPGETISLLVTARNFPHEGGGPLSGISGLLSASTSGVTVTQATTTWPDLGVEGVKESAVANTPFVFTTSPAMVCGQPLDFTVAYTYAEGSNSDLISQTVGPLSPPPPIVLLAEDFSDGIPGGWTVVDGGAAATWTTDNPGGRAIGTPFSDPWAIVDSDRATP
jgi:hypothetical protein